MVAMITVLVGLDWRRLSGGSMSSRQAVVAASRVLCVYMLFWAVSNLIDLPGDILPLHQHLSVLSTRPAIPYDGYLSRYYSLRIETLILKSALELFFAGIFYRCGPRVFQFMAGGSAEFDSTSPAT
jgi:hypothetical protein